MGRLWKIIAASFVLVFVLAIFIAPSIDLPDTVIRGGHAWVAIILAAVAVLLCLLPAVWFFLQPNPATPLVAFDPDRARTQRTC